MVPWLALALAFVITKEIWSRKDKSFWKCSTRTIFRADKDDSYKNHLRIWRGTDFPQSKCDMRSSQKNPGLSSCQLFTSGDWWAWEGGLYKHARAHVSMETAQSRHLQDCWWPRCSHSLTLWSLLLGSVFKIFGSSFIISPLITNVHHSLREELIYFKTSKTVSKQVYWIKRLIRFFFFFVKRKCGFKAGVGKLWPMGQIWPAACFYK